MRLADLPKYALGNTIQLVGAIYAGEDDIYLCPTPGELTTVKDVGDLTDYVLELDEQEWDEFLRRTDYQEVEVTDGVAKAVLRKTQRVIDAAITWACYRRDGYACAYCGRDNVPLTVDHLITWETGGPSIMENMLTACKKCNRTRGDISYAEWLQSPAYASLSHGITGERRAMNIALIDAIKSIRTVNRIKSR